MQFELPARPPMTVIDPELVFRQPTMTKALALCQTISGKPDSHFYGENGIVSNQSQWSRIFSGNSPHCFPHEKLNVFMDIAQNEAPLLWLLNSRGYDIGALRKLETETERRLRIAEEALTAERLKVKVLTDAINGRSST